MRIAFTVPGIPVQWQRTGGSGARRFTVKAMRDHVQLVKHYAALARCRPLSGPVELTCHFFYECPNPLKRSVRPQRLKTTMPDYGNLLKLIEDAIQGHCYANDNTVAGYGKGRKWYAAQGESARTEVEVRSCES